MRRSGVLLTALLLSFLLSGCQRIVRPDALIDFRTDEYADEDEYSTGAFSLSSEGIERVEVWWAAGSVGISAGDSVISAFESGKSLSEDDCMHWRLFDGVLTIRFAASGRSVKLNESDKDLFLTLPEGTDAAVHTSSATVRAGELKGGSIAISTLSGAVSLASVKAERIAVSTSSGSVGIGKAEAESIVCITLSGSASLSSVSAGSLTLSSSSGPLEIGELSAGKAEISAVSGSVSVAVSDCASLYVRTSSGNVVLSLPENEAAVLFSSRSGRFTGECEVSGEGEVEVETASGNLTVLNKKQGVAE